MDNLSGYRIFFRYLELIWAEDKNSSLGGLLGGMSLLGDDSPADPAYAADWNNAIKSAADPQDTYQVGIQFLTNWLLIGYDADIDKVCSDMKANKRQDLWQKSICDIMRDNDDPYLHLIK